MKSLASLVWALLLTTTVLSRTRPQSSSPKSSEKASQSRSNKAAAATASDNVNPANLVAAASDSEDRFTLWLVSRVRAKNQPSQKSSPSSATTPMPVLDVASILKQMNVTMDGLLKELGWTDWQAHIIWSWGDMGPMEAEVQREVQRLDVETNKNMYATCVWPGGLVGRAGRACIMQVYACDAARNKFDDWAWKMTIATQMNNGGAVNSLRGAGASNVAEFIRSNRGCR